MCLMALDIETSDAVALNAEIKASDGSECLNEDVVALRAETKQNMSLDAWMKVRNVSERWNENK